MYYLKHLCLMSLSMMHVVLDVPEDFNTVNWFVSLKVLTIFNIMTFPLGAQSLAWRLMTYVCSIRVRILC